jgi:hypothetical protein
MEGRSWGCYSSTIQQEYRMQKKPKGTSFSLMEKWEKNKMCKKWYQGYASRRNTAGTMVVKMGQLS